MRKQRVLEVSRKGRFVDSCRTGGFETDIGVVIKMWEDLKPVDDDDDDAIAVIMGRHVECATRKRHKSQTVLLKRLERDDLGDHASCPCNTCGAWPKEGSRGRG